MIVWTKEIHCTPSPPNKHTHPENITLSIDRIEFVHCRASCVLQDPALNARAHGAPHCPGATLRCHVPRIVPEKREWKGKGLHKVLPAVNQPSFVYFKFPSLQMPDPILKCLSVPQNLSFPDIAVVGRGTFRVGNSCQTSHPDRSLNMSWAVPTRENVKPPVDRTSIDSHQT